LQTAESYMLVRNIAYILQNFLIKIPTCGTQWC